MTGQGGVGGGFEGGEDVLVLPFDVLLDGFEVFPGDFVRETEEGLVLFNVFSLACVQILRGSGTYQEQVALGVELCGCDFFGHGV